MFDQEFLIRVAEQVIGKEEEKTHLEETGAALVHFEFEVLKAEQPIFASGRSGDYYKFSFEYELTYFDEAHLADVGNEIRRYRRSVRLDADGNVSGVGDRIELAD